MGGLPSLTAASGLSQIICLGNHCLGNYFMATKHYDVRTFSSAESVGYLMKLGHALMHDAATAAFAGHDISFIQCGQLSERALQRHDDRTIGLLQ